MIALNDEQFELIRSRLDAAGLTYTPLSEELLDHICCQVEVLMSRDVPFHQALEQAFDTFPEDEMQEVEQQTISIIQKKWTMKKVSFLVLGLLLAVTTAVWAFQQDPPGISPIKGEYKISSGFGMRVHPVYKTKIMHKGIDIPCKVGTPVRATADGIVEKVVLQDESQGNYIIIRHDEHYQTAYFQLSSNMLVSEGQKIKQGTQIATVGEPVFGGPHLHYEVRKDGEVQNPESYIGL
jgi:murein DD-endopeptidase MepM/ murein hydrolase activator NlpD